LNTQQTALNVQETRLLDSASLFGDLGGGWSADQLHDPRHQDRQQASPVQTGDAAAGTGTVDTKTQ
jgi:hypothetical protein